MEYSRSRLALLLHLLGLTQILPFPQKDSSHSSTVDLLHLCNNPWDDNLLCVGILLSHSIHSLYWSRYVFDYKGVLFMQSTNIKKMSVNLLFWLKMYLGTAIMISLYLIESFARHKINDQFINEKWGVLSFCIPRTLYLNQIWSSKQLPIIFSHHYTKLI